MSKTQKMIFSQNKFYDSRDIPLYYRGRVYEVPAEKVDRWLKRGGLIVADLTPAQLAEVEALKDPDEVKAEPKAKKVQEEKAVEETVKPEDKEETSEVAEGPSDEEPKEEEPKAQQQNGRAHGGGRNQKNK